MADSESKSPYGFCQCGCGQLAPIAKKTCSRLGHIKGQPTKFIHNHHINKSGNPRWNNGKRTDSHGYIQRSMPDHPRANKQGYVGEHILVVEKTLGNNIPAAAWVHHINGMTGDNRPENLVVCQNWGYHMLLHRRTKALIKCGHANWRKCKYCKKYDDPKYMYVSSIPRRGAYHRFCHALYESNRRSRRNLAKIIK